MFKENFKLKQMKLFLMLATMCQTILIAGPTVVDGP